MDTYNVIFRERDQKSLLDVSARDNNNELVTRARSRLNNTNKGTGTVILKHLHKYIDRYKYLHELFHIIVQMLKQSFSIDDECIPDSKNIFLEGFLTVLMGSQNSNTK